MSIPAISFVIGRGAPVLRRTELDATTVAGAKGRALDEGAAACVVRARDLESFRGQKDVVVDRGQKPERKELAALLLGYGRVPLIAGSYRSGGQMRRSIRTLLERAAARGERNLFIIGAADAVFDTLWERAGRAADDSPSDADTILALLPAARVPEELERKFIGTSVQARLVRRLVIRASAQDDPVLIVGDTGTGKEVVARAIHEHSRRRVETFVSVNCAAIPQDLFESELFGHEPESFTGAVHRKPGLWKVADRGTLFLDEIGDLRPDHQAKILRSLQEGTIRPVGAVKEVPVNARVLAATNRDLFAMVRAGRFREDLYYRLRSFFIPTPALGDHPEDIPLLAQHFWRSITRDPGASLAAPVIEALADRAWPGNARELRAVLSNLHGLFGAARIGVEHLAAVSRLQSGFGAADTPPREAGAGHRLECLGHLRRVADVVAASQAAVGELAETEGRVPPAMRRAFRHRLSELEMVSLRPALFGDEVVLQAVAGLRDALREAGPWLSAEPAARRKWARRLEPTVKVALSAVLRELQRLGPS